MGHLIIWDNFEFSHFFLLFEKHQEKKRKEIFFEASGTAKVGS
jgi:hypothetical protein